MKKYYMRLQKAVKTISGYRVAVYSANAAFFMVLSVFPTLILLVALLPYIGYSEQDLMSVLHGLLPEVLEPLLARVIHDLSENSTSTLLSVTAVAAVWSSSRSVYYIQVGLNAIHGIEESRSYPFRRIMSMFYMLLLIAALMLTLVLHGFGQELAALCAKGKVPILQWLAKLLQFRELILAVLLTVLFTAIYYVFPNRRQKLGSLLPGAVLAALGWLIFTYGFSYYVRISGSYSMLYGSLSVIAIAMLWLYICISILFYGSLVNVWLAQRKKSEPPVKPET